MKKPFRLVEVDSLGYVCRDQCVILVNLGDAVHLDGELYWDAISFQVSGKSNGFRPAPAMTVNDDAGILLFLVRESAVMVRIQQAQDSLSRSFPVIALKGLYVDASRISLAQTARELDLAVCEVIVADETTDETDDDYFGVMPPASVVGTSAGRSVASSATTALGGAVFN
jgi:hypothetical protein